MSLRVSETQVHDSARTVHTRSCAVEMASELSQLIESELRKAEGANKPDEHQRRLASLRVKVRPAFLRIRMLHEMPTPRIATS